jgi:hypothetical protein
MTVAAKMLLQLKNSLAVKNTFAVKYFGDYHFFVHSFAFP